MLFLMYVIFNTIVLHAGPYIMVLYSRVYVVTVPVITRFYCSLLYGICSTCTHMPCVSDVASRDISRETVPRAVKEPAMSAVTTATRWGTSPTAAQQKCKRRSAYRHNLTAMRRYIFVWGGCHLAERCPRYLLLEATGFL